RSEWQSYIHTLNRGQHRGRTLERFFSRVRTKASGLRLPHAGVAAVKPVAGARTTTAAWKAAVANTTPRVVAATIRLLPRCPGADGGAPGGLHPVRSVPSQRPLAPSPWR